MNSENLNLPPEDELEESFVRSASGPGGQKVNKSTSSVRIAYRFMESSFLADSAKERLKKLNGGEDILVVSARDSRSLEMNRNAARERLAELLASAMIEPKKRKKTKPKYSAKLKRLESKSRRSLLKSNRGKVSPE